MVLAKIMKFLYPFFLAKIGKDKVLGNVLDRKRAFLNYKNIDFCFLLRTIQTLFLGLS